MATLAQRLAAGLRLSGLRCEGVNLFYADGEAAGQEVFHSHLHVIPRYDGDPFQITADWDSHRRDRLLTDMPTSYERPFTAAHNDNSERTTNIFRRCPVSASLSGWFLSSGDLGRG
ncbi:MAG: HIT family protein [Actinomycetota bacterium]